MQVGTVRCIVVLYMYACIYICVCIDVYIYLSCSICRPKGSLMHVVQGSRTCSIISPSLLLTWYQTPRFFFSGHLLGSSAITIPAVLFSGLLSLTSSYSHSVATTDSQLQSTFSPGFFLLFLSVLI
ncbi:hypothetical protein IHE45_05G118100 [Dioscorea alata]|uniref:Uncharacterized protein n=1 Tax=Dioscorea alata TaxID=55571 RepID=A0ACB7W4L7_DIOAL|nr:hypothetical protein IHE45_05G118100 [Dioscorea alata]